MIRWTRDTAGRYVGRIGQARVRICLIDSGLYGSKVLAVWLLPGVDRWEAPTVERAQEIAEETLQQFLNDIR